jgi:hypothetical protein
MTGSILEPSIKNLLSVLCPSTPESLQTALSRITDTDWENIVNLSKRQGLTPILYKRLKEISDRFEIPAEIIEITKNYYLSNIVRNVRIQHNLGRILKLFNETGIEAIVLKGAYLSEAVYGNIALRTMSDIDILVKSSDISQAEQLILSLGYITHSQNRQIGNKHFVYERPHDSTPLELHWHIVTPVIPVNINIQDIWDRACQTEVKGIRRLVQSPEDLLIHICFHAAFTHTFNQFGLRSLWDVKVILKHFAGRLNWEQVRETASDWRVGKSVYFTLVIAEEVLNMRMPDGVLKIFRDSCSIEVNKVLLLEAEHIRTAIEQIQCTDLEFNRNLSLFWCSENIVGSARILLKRIIPSVSEMRKMYSLKSHTVIVYLYYFTRVWSLFRRYWKTFTLLLRSDPKTIEKARSEKRRHSMQEWMIEEIT